MRMVMRRTIKLALLLVCSLVSGWMHPAGAQTLRIGTEGAYPPFEYRDASGKAVTTVELGDELEVHLRVRATGPERIGFVALVDLLPGGFEPVQEPTPLPEGEAEETKA